MLENKHEPHKCTQRKAFIALYIITDTVSVNAEAAYLQTCGSVLPQTEQMPYSNMSTSIFSTEIWKELICGTWSWRVQSPTSENLYVKMKYQSWRFKGLLDLQRYLKTRWCSWSLQLFSFFKNTMFRFSVCVSVWSMAWWTSPISACVHLRSALYSSKFFIQNYSVHFLKLCLIGSESTHRFRIFKKSWSGWVHGSCSRSLKVKMNNTCEFTDRNAPSLSLKCNNKTHLCFICQKPGYISKLLYA